ncbi:MAG: exonuclease SbcCD subunit D [bacterium]
MNERARIMVTGDLHLGVHPSGIPDELDSKAYSPGQTWGTIVDECVKEDVDALVVTGDVVDRANQFYEAWGPFEAGVSDLAANDIPLVMVAGNHDADVLPEFVDSLDADNCHLVGRGGQWQRVTLTTGDDTAISFDGWSYPDREVRKNPLDEYDSDPAEEPLFGLLHTELDRPGSPYAPTTEEDLKRTPVDGWLLGHIHKPAVHSENPLVLNPGSPQPLNPTETGIHGPWLLTVKPDGSSETVQEPLANLEYQSLEIDVTDLESPERLTGEIKDRLSRVMNQRDPVNDRLGLISTRLTLTGRADRQREYERESHSLRDSLQFSLNGARVAIEKIENTIRPAVDLQELAEGTGPVAVLSDLLMKLENGDTDRIPEELMEETEDAVQTAYGASTYEPLRVQGDGNPPDAESQRRMLRKQGRSLLEELLDQKEDPV